nr:hypothetical protein [Tanacetum cinerariifolium]
MAADNGFVNLEQLRLLANLNLLKDQLLVYFDLKTQREVQLATEINNLTRQLLDIIDERRSFIGELEQRLPKNVMAYKTRQELKCHHKDDMIRAMEMRSTALQLHHQAMKGFHFYKSLTWYYPNGLHNTIINLIVLRCKQGLDGGDLRDYASVVSGTDDGR